jgi:hypothetical protein
LWAGVSVYNEILPCNGGMISEIVILCEWRINGTKYTN